jgi:hypothetical protein
MQSAVTQTTSRGPTRDRSLLHRRAHNHRTTGVEANMTTDKRHLVRRRGYQIQHVNRRGDRWTAGDLTVESRTTDVSRRRHRDNRRHGDLQHDSNKMMLRQQRETSDHDMIQQHNNRQHISIQLISVCLVTVIFVVTHIHQAVNFVRPLTFNVFTVQNWAIWPKCVVVDQQLQAIHRIVNTRDSHPDALRVRVISEQFNQTKTFWLYRLISKQPLH